MDERRDLQLGETERLQVAIGKRAVIVIGEEIETPYLAGAGLDNLTLEHSGTGLSVTEKDRTLAGEGLEVHLPSQWSADFVVEVGSGAVSVAGVSGRARLAARNGAVKAVDFSGALDVSAANGSITCSRVEGSLRAAAANGKITVHDSRVSEGRVHAANGRVALQLQPTDGKLVVFSANGRTLLALPEDGDFTVRARTMSRLVNRLAAGRISQERGVSTIVAGAGTFSVLIHNLRGGVELVKHADFDPDKVEEDSDGSRHNEWWFDMDFTEEFPRFVKGIRRFGRKFGRMGEEISREFRDAWGASDRPPRPPRQETPADDTEEVRMILDMLGEGKITVEEAEKLIAAMRGR